MILANFSFIFTHPFFIYTQKASYRHCRKLYIIGYRTSSSISARDGKSAVPPCFLWKDMKHPPGFPCHLHINSSFRLTPGNVTLYSVQSQNLQKCGLPWEIRLIRERGNACSRGHSLSDRIGIIYWHSRNPVSIPLYAHVHRLFYISPLCCPQKKKKH